MTDIQQIYDFAVKWCDIFRDPNTGYKDLIDKSFADECNRLGFLMDCGDSFSRKYGQAATKYNKLYEVINNITDIQLLGSAIYSRWRFFAHWSYSAVGIASFENRAWFAAALFRLATLTEDNSSEFHGNLKMIRIVSNNTNTNRFSSPNTEIVQHIAIQGNGDVYFDGCTSDIYTKNYTKVRTKHFSLGEAAVKHLFDVVTSYFTDKYHNAYSVDTDNWLLELTDSDGVTYKFRGSFHDDFKNLSDTLRDILGMKSLYLLDGNFEADAINKITLEYTKTEKVMIKKTDEPKEWVSTSIPFSELLIIDRRAGVIEHSVDFGTGRRISQKYESDDLMKQLFDRFANEILFTNISPDSINAENGKHYKITVEYENRPSYTISGSFNKDGLPKGFDYFIKTVYEFTNLYGTSDIFNPAVYGKTSYKHSSCIMCSVVFEFGDKKYYYLTDDESIKVGDSVLVPTGNDNIETVATVVEIKHFDIKRLPFPTNRLKRIICKCINTN